MNNVYKTIFKTLLLIKKKVVEGDKSIIEDINKMYEEINNSDVDVDLQMFSFKALFAEIGSLINDDEKEKEELFVNVVKLIDFEGRDLFLDKRRLSKAKTDDEKKQIVREILERDKPYDGVNDKELYTFYSNIVRLTILHFRDNEMIEKAIKAVESL